MIYYANSECLPSDKNPFSKDSEYGEKWSAFIYDEDAKYYTQVEKNVKVYTIRVSIKRDKNYERLTDFVSYETKYNRNIIIKADIEVRRIIDKLLSKSSNNVIRETDSRWLVHSTTKASWESIKNSKFLYSPSELRKRGIMICEIGLKYYLEPIDYSDYIMLDILDGCGELVVNSRQLGYVCTDGSVLYKPGVRLYFDAHRIIEDGLGIRDGLHILKVKKELPLERYLISVVEKDLIEPKEIWTPTTYTEEANNYFLNSVRV